MPKDTFFNLPEEKRQQIEATALDEFIEYGFEKASINRIVAAAGIAKGSFYQYFENKADLFMHMITLIAEKKMAYVSPVFHDSANYDFFTMLEEMFRSGLAFVVDHPKESQLLYEIYQNQNNPLFVAVMQENRRAAKEFYGKLLDLGIQRGELDPNLNKPFIIHMLISTQLSVIDYYQEQRETSGWSYDFMPVVQLMIDFIKNGIQCQELGEPTQ